jgi:hypothetical protein
MNPQQQFLLHRSACVRKRRVGGDSALSFSFFVVLQGVITNPDCDERQDVSTKRHHKRNTATTPPLTQNKYTQKDKREK